MEYDEFLATKSRDFAPVGFEAKAGNALLFRFQEAIVEWALKRGRAAIFADCGLGKTPMQLAWAHHVSEHTGKPVLIFAPLAVARQTQREGDKFGYPVTVCRTAADVMPGINVTNYEMLAHFDPAAFGGLVLDESSILKAYEGKTRRVLNEFASGIEYRLACTATPAPNDHVELINHAEYLGIMQGKEVKATFFRQDGNTTHAWRLKGHAREPFWQWLASWSVALRTPADLNDHEHTERFLLPELQTVEHALDTGPTDGMLFPVVSSLADRRTFRRNSIDDRVAQAAELVAAEPDEQWLIWCNLNDESMRTTAAIPGAVEITGSEPREDKARKMLAFSDGEIRVLVTKPLIAGFGMNWQQCARCIFLGLSDSYEQYYQALRRIWRFGQEREVSAHIIITEAERAVLDNVSRKEAEARVMFDELIKHMSIYGEITHARKSRMVTERESRVTGDYEIELGDSVETLDGLAEGAIDLWVYSPPFPGMYAYTSSESDIGNVSSIDELMEHYEFMLPKLYRAMAPGRVCAVHLCQEQVFQYQEGYVGRRDFRGRIIAAHERAGWQYYSEVTIDKNPQIKAARTKDRALLFKTLSNNSALSAPCMADYLIIFRKEGEGEPVRSGIHERYNPEGGWITQEEWIEWAAPVWYRSVPDYPGGISETDVLSTRAAKETDDDKHLAPLQLGVIERAVKLWSNPGDIVGDPFTGIGSTVYVALSNWRKAWGCELKRSYWQQAVANAELAVKTRKKDQGDLFDDQTATG